MRRRYPDIAAILILFLTVGIFFFRLFYPTPHLILTPDFGRSDAWHFSFATKYALSQALHTGSLPLWRPDIGDGFPLLAEGQTGTYFLPNLLLFSQLPPVTAYNLALALAILTIALGTYLAARLHGHSWPSSLLSAIVFSYSGLPILQLTHITLLQGMSLLPLIIALTILLFRNGAFPWMALLSLTITQQFFAGFPQATFLTMLLAGAYACWKTYTDRKYGAFIAFCIASALGLIGAAAQILPSWEFLRMSTNPSGFDFLRATQYSMPLIHLLTFINPYALGNPRWGTYPPFYAFGGSIFWENTAYIGLIPLCFICVTWLRRRKVPEVVFYTVVLLTSLLLAWGRYSPAYIIFTLWPFNLFRVPSRFLWLAAFSLSMLAAFGSDVVVRMKKGIGLQALLWLSMFLAFLQLTQSWWNYHLLLPANAMLTLTHQETLPSGKLYTVGASGAHNAVYITHGSQQAAPFILLYKESGSPDANILYHEDQHDVYAGRFLYRSMIADSVLSSLMPFDTQSATVSSDLMLNLLGINHVISYLPVDSPTLILKDTKTVSAITRRIYDNPHAVPRAYLVREATTAASINEALTRLDDRSFVVGRSALLETKDVAGNARLLPFADGTIASNTSGSVTITHDTDTTLSLSVNAGGYPALLILTDTYYPGWVARIDGSETPIYPVNIKQRAIAVPAGYHTVQFVYQPHSVSLGLTITILTELIVACLMVDPFGLLPDTVQKTRRMLMRPSRNPDR